MKYSNASIRERGDGRWQARFYFKDGDSWKEVSRSFKATSRRAAKKRADEIKEQLERAAAAEGSEGLAKLPEEDMTVEGFLRRFVDNLENSGQIERTTAAGYRASAEHASRYLADKRIDELTGEMILDWQDKLLNEDCLCSDSVAKDHRLFKQALSFAVEIGALEKSPFTKSVKAPRRRRRDPNSLDDESRMRLLVALDGMVDSELTLGVRLGLSAGLRREEICGLRWRDADLKGNVIHVRNAVTEANGRTYKKPPKSESSRRDVPLEPDLAGRLRARRDALARAVERARLDSWYVLGGERWYLPSRLGKEFSSLSKALDLVCTAGTRVCLHDLRHTYATFLIARGVDVKTVSSLMGHADATVTLNVYASADPRARQQAAEVVATAMAERAR